MFVHNKIYNAGGENMETVIIGNKNDLPDEEREVTTLEGEELAAELSIPFLETSALTGNNVEVIMLQSCLK